MRIVLDIGLNSTLVVLWQRAYLGCVRFPETLWEVMVNIEEYFKTRGHAGAA